MVLNNNLILGIRVPNLWFQSEVVYDDDLSLQAWVLDRGIHGMKLMACSPKANEKGITTHLSLKEAKALYPDLLSIVVDFDHGQKLMDDLVVLLSKMTDRVVQYGDNMLYMDLSNLVHNFNDPKDLVDLIKRAVTAQFAIRVDLGLSTNRLLAYLACDLGPLMTRNDVFEKLGPLSLSQLNVLSKGQQEIAKDLGLTKVKDLVAMDLHPHHPLFSVKDALLGKQDDFFIPHFKKTSIQLNDLFQKTFNDHYESIFSYLSRYMASRLAWMKSSCSLLTLYGKTAQGRIISISSESEDGFWDQRQIYGGLMKIWQNEPSLSMSKDLTLVADGLQSIRPLLSNPQDYQSSDSIIGDLNHFLGDRVFKKASDILDERK